MKQGLHTSSRSSDASPAARRDFGIVLAARSLSFLGDMLLLTVIALQIAAGDQPWRLTVVYIAFAVPLFALAPVAGRIADEYDSRRVLVFSGLLQAAAAVGMALSGSFWLLVAAIVMLQAGQAVSTPGWSALVPRIVGNKGVGRATGHLAAAGAIAGMAGAALGGFIYGPLGFRGAVLINAAGFVVIAMSGALVRTRRGRRFDRADAESATADIAADADPAHRAAEAGAPEETSGWRFCRRDTVLSVLLPALWALVVAGEALNVAEVFLIRGVLGATPAVYGICGAAFLVGSIVGPLLAGRVDGDRARIRWSAITAALSGALIVGMAVSPSAWVVAGLLAVAGVLMGAFNALIVAVMLVRPPDSLRGRVMATVNGTMRGFTIVALVLGGLLVQFTGARVTFAIIGVLVAAAAVLIRRVTSAVPAEQAVPDETVPADQTVPARQTEPASSGEASENVARP